MTPSHNTILITGAGGFIGSHLSAALLGQGRYVVGLDSFDDFYDPAVKLANINRIRSGGHGDRFTLVRADIRDAEAVRACMRDHAPKSIIHLAARAGVRPSIANPALYADVNVVGTATMLDAATHAGVERFLFASSSSVYGDSAKVPFNEDRVCDSPMSPYAATKISGELIARAHHQLHNLNVACLRFFTVYGPLQRPDLAIAKFMQQIARNEPITLFGDGSTSRDYTYISDIVAGVVSALDRIDQFGFRTWNLGSDSPFSLNDMVEHVAKAVGKTPIIQRAPEQSGDVQRTWADIARSKQELDYSPATRFQDGLKQQWEAMCRIAETPEPIVVSRHAEVMTRKCQ